MFVPGLNCWCIFFLRLKGSKCGPVEGPQDGECSLVKTEATVKSRKRADASAGKTRWDLLSYKSIHVLFHSPWLPETVCYTWICIADMCWRLRLYISKVLTLTVSVWGRGKLIPLLPASKGWNPRGHIVWFFTATNYLAFKLLIILSVCNFCIISHSPEDDHDWCPPGFGFRLLRQALTNNACTYCSCVLLTESHKISQFGHDHYWGWFTSFSDDCIWSRFGF